MVSLPFKKPSCHPSLFTLWFFHVFHRLVCFTGFGTRRMSENLFVGSKFKAELCTRAMTASQSVNGMNKSRLLRWWRGGGGGGGGVDFNLTYRWSESPLTSVN